MSKEKSVCKKKTKTTLKKWSRTWQRGTSNVWQDHQELITSGKENNSVHFLADTVHLKVASYDNINIKLSAEDMVQMPNVAFGQATWWKPTSSSVRRQTLFHLIDLPSSTCWRSVKQTTAEAMQGLDNTIEAGEEASTTLHRVVDHLGETGQTAEWTRQKKQCLMFISSIWRETSKPMFKCTLDVPDHCIHRLSDPYGLCKLRSPDLLTY